MPYSYHIKCEIPFRVTIESIRFKSCSQSSYSWHIFGKSSDLASFHSDPTAKIPSEMEEAPRYTSLHCLQCWHGLRCWHGLHRWHGLLTLFVDTVYTAYTIQTAFHFWSVACMPIYIFGKGLNAIGMSWCTSGDNVGWLDWTGWIPLGLLWLLEHLRC